MGPRVSVVMPSFQHEQFVGDSIGSVLSQSFSDLELIVVDDGSVDNSRAVISGISDSRLKPVFLEQNLGASEATNIGIRRAAGEFVAICNSDDVWEPNKLLAQIQFLDEHSNVSAVFSDVKWIDQTGVQISAESLPSFSDIFSQRNRSRFAWQRMLVENGNCLCHPSVLVRKSVYDEVGLYNNYLRQLPDYEMWLRVLQKFDIHVMKDRLIQFRIHTGNTSTQNPVSQARTWAEHVLIARSYFQDVEHKNFIAAFGGKHIVDINGEDGENEASEKISYLLENDGTFSEIFKRLALEMAYDEMRTGKSKPIGALQFHSYSGDVNSGFGAKIGRRHHQAVNEFPLIGKLMTVLRRWNRARLKRRRERRYSS